MAELTVYFATNRRHRGRDRWKPSGYSGEPSKDGSENLRFGRVRLSFSEDRVQRELNRDCGFGTGDGEKLAAYLHSQRRHARIDAFEERLLKFESDAGQDPSSFGSTRAFSDLQAEMAAGCDVLVFIHGFNVSWWQAVASAGSLQLMLNRTRGVTTCPVKVVLFTWPSDGRAIPYWSYFSDRGDAVTSGNAVGRGFLKLRDYLIQARREARQRDEAPCRQALHLLCHSMGNYVLQNALRRTADFSTGGKLPRIFDHVFLCAPDVADDVFEPGKPLRSLPETAEQVTIYHNRGDLAMPVSDYTKGNSDRLGWRGASRPAELDGRVHQVDCSPIVEGLIEHSYFLCGRVNDDIAASIARVAPDSEERQRNAVRNGWPNIWRMR
jgi:esterase/lipase superfamily enzyme